MSYFQFNSDESLDKFNPEKMNKKERYYQMSNNIKKYINYHTFVKQQPNMILIKEDVKLLLENDMTIHFNNMSCPDEHYFINLLIHLFKRKIIKKQIHFCNYDFHKTQSLDFYNINDTFIDKIRNYGFLFMRKVNDRSIIDVNYLLKFYDDLIYK